MAAIEAEGKFIEIGIQMRGCDRYFAAADRAGPAPICRPPTLSQFTLWAANPSWPSQLLQICVARLFIGKPGAKLLPCSRIWWGNSRIWRISYHYI